MALTPEQFRAALRAEVTTALDNGLSVEEVEAELRRELQSLSMTHDEAREGVHKRLHRAREVVDEAERGR